MSDYPYNTHPEFLAAHVRAQKAKEQASGPLDAAACYVPPCDKCGSAQTQLGGIEFGPPMLVFDFSGKALPGFWWQKLHVCVKCTSAHNVQAHSQKGRERGPDNTQD